MYIKGIIVKIKDTDKLVLTKQPLSLVEAQALKLKYELQGHTVFLGSEIKIYRCNKVSNKSSIPTLLI